MNGSLCIPILLFVQIDATVRKAAQTPRTRDSFFTALSDTTKIPFFAFFRLTKLNVSQKYANAFEKEKVGMVELPYLSEERLQKMGVPLGPRLRILQEARISVCKDPIYVV